MSGIMSKQFQVSCPISQEIWDMKYRYKAEGGLPGDVTLADSWSRVAYAIAGAENPDARARWASRFEDALSTYEFLPAGRILAGAGTGRNVTLFNCFVMGLIEDDMASIFDNVKEAALTMQQGGGIGHDFSSLRPRGAPVSSIRSAKSESFIPSGLLLLLRAECSLVIRATSLMRFCWKSSASEKD